MDDTIDKILNSIEYWQDRNLLLSRIHNEYYMNKHLIVQLLNITSADISHKNEAKKEMWNYQISYHRMGDSILKNVHSDILKDFEFAKLAISKYNRAYKYLDRSLQTSYKLALLATRMEVQSTKDRFSPPILQYMPDVFKSDSEIALMATTKNIENLAHAPNLKKNRRFIIDTMNRVCDYKIRKKILKYIDKDLLNDKSFVAQLGCFNNLCEEFNNDIEYLLNAIKHDITILEKIKIFDEEIIQSIINSKAYDKNKEQAIGVLFIYIKRFFTSFEEFNENINDKSIIHKLFWDFGEITSSKLI
jgi:hypothetical protein